MAELSDSTNWSEVDASNNQSPPAGWPAGMNPSQVEPTARAMMGAIKRFWDRINGTVTTTGAAGAYVYTPASATWPAAYVQGETITFRANFTSVGGDTLNVNSLGARPLYKTTGSGLAAVAAGNIQSGALITCVYDGNIGGSGAFQVTGGLNPSASDFTGTLPVANGGTGLTSGTSGGVLAYTGSGVLASSAALAANKVVLGGGAGAVPATSAIWSVEPTDKYLIGDFHNSGAAGTPGFSTPCMYVQGKDATSNIIQMDSYAAVSSIVARRAGGTNAAKSATASGASIFTIQARGYGTLGYSSGARAGLNFVAAETWTDTAQGTNFIVSVSPIGAATAVTALTVNAPADGGVVFSGTTAGDNAAAGVVGEYKSSIVTIGSAVDISSAANIGSITLTPGDWDVSGELWLDNNTGGATITGRVIGTITATSATAATIPADDTGRACYDSTLLSSNARDITLAIPPVRMSVTVNTSAFLVGFAAVSGGTPFGYGKISARRVR